eukprot:2452010-Amphidinium_carterae.1
MVLSHGHLCHRIHVMLSRILCQQAPERGSYDFCCIPVSKYRCTGTGKFGRGSLRRECREPCPTLACLARSGVIP